MPQFAANISLLFGELPYADRFKAAADAGFAAVEVLFPYEHPAKETSRGLLANGLDLVLINAPPPNYTGGQPGYAAIPGGEDRFQSDMRRTLRFAGEIKPELIHVMAGYDPGPGAFQTFVQNLQWIADQAPQQRFTIEPLNQTAQPGYFLNDYSLAVEVLSAVERSNVGLQYDTYHAQMIHGDAAGIWERHRDHVFHVQIGTAPDRTEPAPGSIDFPALFAAIDGGGYAGWVSAEYTPSVPVTEDTLGWMSW